MSILVIGAGERRVKGAVHQDIQALPGIDLVCDFWELSQHSEKYNEIHMTHVLEHFPMAKVPEVLKLIHNLMQPGARLYIEVPNFQWHAEQIVKDPTNRQIVNYAFGGQLNEWDFHYNGFTPDILYEDLEQAGFVVESLNPNSSIECYAVRP